MLFTIISKDKPDSLDLRLQTRPSHLEYIKSLGDAVKLGGPFLDENGKPCGSLVIVEGDNIEGAREIASNDPYTKAGLFASTEISAWSWTVKNPENA
ncbi:YciI-like protein [Chelativorans composti]|jgi:Uncharacterized protein conserved in bacteria|uniref:YciI family protein n=1 Tax=Chelativorans composti TaxID=768533 RepID=A0ABW5DES7_9HYPH